MNIINEATGQINYGTIRQAYKSLARDINTLEEYSVWVREWKEWYKAITAAIRTYRSIKNDLKHGRIEKYGQIYSPMTAHGYKLALRPYARQMLELRAAQKERYKAGAFKRIEEAA